MNKNLMEINSFFNLDEDSCYFFSYANLSIEDLAKLFNRSADTFDYKNCHRGGFERVFCVSNDNQVVASIYKSLWGRVTGILVKITWTELELLELYHKDYDLYTMDVRISYPLLPDSSKEGILEYCQKKSYVFIHKNPVNQQGLKPSTDYINSIKNMLNDRKKLEPYKIIKPVEISCVKLDEDSKEHYIIYIDEE